jgi:hypothetical protein
VAVEGLTVSVVNVIIGTRVVQTDVEVPITSEVYVDKTSEVSVKTDWPEVIVKTV